MESSQSSHSDSESPQSDSGSPRWEDVDFAVTSDSLLEAVNEEEFGIAQMTEEAYNESESLRIPTEEEIRQIEETLQPSPPTSDANSLFEWFLTRHGARAYAFQEELDEVGAVILGKWATKEGFDAHRKTLIRSLILKGFPLKVQQLINSPDAKGNARVKAMGKLNRIIRGLRKHCYGDEGNDDDTTITILKRASRASKGDDLPPSQSLTKDGKDYPFSLDFFL